MCPRCGVPAGDLENCGNCGLGLLERSKLPTWAEWKLSQGENAANSGSVEYLINAAYWTVGLSILMPLLMFPVWGFGFLIIVKGRRDAGLWLFFLSALVASASLAAWLAIFGAFAGSSNGSGGTGP